MKLKTSQFFQRRKKIVEREKREQAEIKAAVAAILGRLTEQKQNEKSNII